MIDTLIAPNNTLLVWLKAPPKGQISCKMGYDKIILKIYPKGMATFINDNNKVDNHTMVSKYNSSIFIFLNNLHEKN